MNSGPTPVSATVAGTPLSQQGIQTRKRSSVSVPTQSQNQNAISDTLETNDREADGRDVYVQSEVENENQERLDLTG